MRDANRLKEKFTLSLDGRQVASVVVGSLVVWGRLRARLLGGAESACARARPAAPRTTR
jgi:hypothetical protein